MRTGTSLSTLTLVAVLLFSTATLAAQDAQRLPDGKPNFSGLWGAGGAAVPAANLTQPPVLTSNVNRPAARLPTRRERGIADLPLTDWGRQAFMYFTAADGEYGNETGTVGDTRYHGIYCGGPHSPADVGNTMQIFHTPQLLQITYETGQPWIRKIFIGREHPADLEEYVPFWMGHSVGRWDGDTLIVDTIKIKTWEGSMISNNRAEPQTDKLHLIERFQLLPDGRLRIEATYDDPIAYTKPWSRTANLGRRTNWDDMAYIWNLEESHDVCEAKGGFWAEHDPWFANYDQLAEDILPDLETLKKGKPPVPQGAESVENFLGPFGQPKR